MASVGNSVRKSIEDWTNGDIEFSMLHACNAVDGTSKKTYPNISRHKDRFTDFLRDNYSILGPMGFPGINIVATRWPVVIGRPKPGNESPDVADVIYGIHRCTHGHGDELPDGFELLQDASGPEGYTRLNVERGKVQLSDRVIFGLLAIAVLSSANLGQNVPDGYYLQFAEHILPINDWWGRAEDFVTLTKTANLPSVTIDFKKWQ